MPWYEFADTQGIITVYDIPLKLISKYHIMKPHLPISYFSVVKSLLKNSGVRAEICVKFQNGLLTEMNLMGKWDSRGIIMSFDEMFYIYTSQQPLDSCFPPGAPFTDMD